jgi:hypothetical protein
MFQEGLDTVSQTLEDTMKPLPELLISVDISATDTPEQIQSLLELFNRYQVHATFFVTLAWAHKYPDDARKLATGHELGLYQPAGAAVLPESDKVRLEQIAGRKVYGFRASGVVEPDFGRWKAAGYVYHAALNGSWYHGWAQPRSMHLKQGCYIIPPSVSSVVRYPLNWPGIWYMPGFVTRYVSRHVIGKDGMLACSFSLEELGGHGTTFSLVAKRLEGYLDYLRSRGVFNTHIGWLYGQLQGR